MGFNEFKELFAALNGWKQNFMMFDQDRSGTVEPHEMTQAINTMGEQQASVFRPPRVLVWVGCHMVTVYVCVCMCVAQVTASALRPSTPS